MLSEHGTPIAPRTYYDVLKGEPSRQALRDKDLKVDVARVHHENYDPEVRLADSPAALAAWFYDRFRHLEL